MAFISFDVPIDPDDRAVGRKPPPGRDLAERLLAGVQAAGFQIVEPVSQHDSYGWCFTVTDPRTVWCMLQLSDEWLLITQSRLPLLRRWFGGAGLSPEHEKFDAAVLTVLSAVPHVSNVRWFRTQEDLRQGLASQP
jgi:hypothetical protein